LAIRRSSADEVDGDVLSVCDEVVYGHRRDKCDFLPTMGREREECAAKDKARPLSDEQQNPMQL
jgi:hypothetical protein